MSLKTKIPVVYKEVKESVICPTCNKEHIQYVLDVPEPSLPETMMAAINLIVKGLPQAVHKCSCGELFYNLVDYRKHVMDGSHNESVTRTN